MTQTRWKVGQTEKTQYRGGINTGYGFYIQAVNGVPLLKITYSTEEDAKLAEETIRKALDNAVEIMK